MFRSTSWTGVTVLGLISAVFLLTGCERPEEVFRQASREDTAVAYEDFLKKYAEAPEASETRERLAAREAFDQAADTGTPQAWWTIIETEAAGHLASEVRQQFVDATIAAALEGWPDDGPPRPTPEEARRLASDPRIGADEASAGVREFLLALVAAMPPAARTRISGLPASAPLRIRDDAPAIASCVSGTVNPSRDPDTAVPVQGRALLGDGDQVLLVADGSLAVDHPAAWLTGVVGSVTLTAREGGGTDIRAATGGEEVLLICDWLGVTRPAIPAAPGSVLRLEGKIEGLAAGWTFVGDVDDPLVLCFFEDGPVYVGGSGTATGLDGKEFEFPAAAAGLPPIALVLEQEPAQEDPPTVQLWPAPRRMTVDREGTLMWMRDPVAAGAFPLIGVDPDRVVKHEGENWVPVDRNAEMLADLGSESDVLIRDGETFVSWYSLCQVDGWDRYWDLDAGRSWYRRCATDELLTRRFMKTRKAPAHRKIKKEPWSGPDENHDGAGGPITISLSTKGDAFVQEGQIVFHMGKPLPPVLPLVQGLRSRTPDQIVEWLRFYEPALAPKPTNPEEERVHSEFLKELQGVKAVLANPDLTIAGFRDALGRYPHFRGILANRDTDWVLILAVTVNKNAGQNVQGFSDSSRALFTDVGSTYRLDLKADCPYPLGPDLDVWAGTVRVVKDIDGLPLKWVDDGTWFRLVTPRLLRAEGVDSGGRLNLAIVGRYAEGYPRDVLALQRHAAYLTGPLQQEALLLDVSSADRNQPGPRSLTSSRFGETLGLPGD